MDVPVEVRVHRADVGHEVPRELEQRGGGFGAEGRADPEEGGAEKLVRDLMWL